MADRTRTHRGVNYVVTVAHPAADAFPWLGDDELQALADDIAATDQRDDIELLRDGRLLDGRNRELACRIAGVVPRYVTREDELTDAEIIARVLSRNLHRRHLEPGQRAMVAAELANITKPGRPDEITARAAISQSAAAKQLDVSTDSVQRAKKVTRQAPELVEAVKDGRLDVKTAAKVADLPKKSRKKVAEADDPKAAAKEELKEEAEPETPADEGADFVRHVEGLCRELDQVAARVKALKKSPFAYSIHIDSAAFQIDAARKTLWQGRPAHVCPYCRGEGCKEACHGTGRVKKATYDSGREAMGEAA